MSKTETTNVLGYFNGNDFDIEIHVSKLRVCVTLKPQQFIRDRKGRKINDPFFDSYVKSKLLNVEFSPSPVPVLRIPEPQAVPQPQDGQAVRQVTEFTSDGKPVIPEPKIIPQPTGQHSSVKSMSVEEAKKMGLIPKTRPVPEDFGTPDTDGAPPRDVPDIKYAKDAGGKRPVAPLPTEILAEAANPELVRQLSKSPPPLPEQPVDVAEGFMDAEDLTPPAAPEPPPKAVVAPEPVPAPKAPEPQPEDMPEPVLDSVPEPGGEPEPEPKPKAKRKRARRKKAAPLKVESESRGPKRPYVCSECKADFMFRSQLDTHAKHRHRAKVEAIMGVYPE